MRDMVDGLSNTLIIGERDSEENTSGFVSQHEHGVIYAIHWTTHADADADNSVEAVTGCGSAPINWDPPTGHPDDGQEDENFSSRHAGGAQFLLGDGSVRFVSENISFDWTIHAENAGSNASNNMLKLLLRRNNMKPLREF